MTTDAAQGPGARRPRRSNDQHYKTLLREFLRELLQITHPALVRHLRFDQVHFLDKETYTDLLGGSELRMDLVCQIGTDDGGQRLLVINIEVEERTRGAVKITLGERICNYFMTLALRHGLPVLPILVSFAPGPSGLVTEVHEMQVLGETVMTLRYRRLGVRGLRAEAYLRSRNPLGWALAIRMGRGRMSKVDLELACERRIVHAHLSESKKILLLNRVQSGLCKFDQDNFQIITAICSSITTEAKKDASPSEFRREFVR